MTAHPLALEPCLLNAAKSLPLNLIQTVSLLVRRIQLPHPGRVVHSQCSNRRPDSIIQEEKAEKEAKCAKKQQKVLEQDDAATAIAEYERGMVVNDAIEDTQFPRHRGMSHTRVISS